ncbi:TOMM precursor leader peptide-binding protein [Amycolatopsis pigmentata]|uniref:TOMM leader peptide-binding protein n=1 Tax=Amycolatopsis pigmentata TaxID=450801 RepID=A0ABW5FQE0_9PSEU
MVSEPRLAMAGLQTIPLPSAVLLRRGAVEVKITGTGAGEVVRVLLSAFAPPGATPGEVCARFPERDRPAVRNLVDELRQRRLLLPEDVVAEPEDVDAARRDVFHWHFGQQEDTVRGSLSSRRITVIGVNAVSARLLPALSAAGAANVELIDFPQLRNIALRPEDVSTGQAAEAGPDWLEGADADTVGCVVATSDFGPVPGLRLWNRFCAERRIPFLPVVLDNLIGTVGPLFLLGETPCYECLRARADSHVDDLQARREIENAAFEGQRFAALHPAAATILAELSAVELTRWFGGGRPLTRQAGTLVEVTMAEPAVVTRKVLRVPHCPVCGPATTHSASTVWLTEVDPR